MMLSPKMLPGRYCGMRGALLLLRLRGNWQPIMDLQVGRKAMRGCFDAWLESFGGTGNREERAILSQVRAFFEAHGASRFQDIEAENDPRIINRAGFYRAGTDRKREFIVL